MRLGSAIFFVSLLSAVTVSASPSKVCVRNYPADAEVSPCKKFPDAYAYVIPWTSSPDGTADDSKVCTRIYGETYCDAGAKEYVHVPTEDGRTICVLDFDQPGVTSFCNSVPDFYHWVMGLPQ